MVNVQPEKKGLLVGFWKWQFVHCLGKTDCDKQ